jgi:hypothetical protein
MPVVFAAVDMRHDGLGDAPGQLLAQGPHRCRDLRQGGRRLVPLRLQGIEPLVKALVELVAQGAPLFSCTNLLKRDNLSRSHR